MRSAPSISSPSWWGSAASSPASSFFGHRAALWPLQLRGDPAKPCSHKSHAYLRMAHRLSARRDTDMTGMGNSAEQPSRRGFLRGALLGAASLAAAPKLASAANDWVAIENFSAVGKSEGITRLHKVVKSEADWKKQLAANAFEITRHADTEPPFTGVYWNNHGDGLYRCICCDTALFDSHT